MLAVTLIAIVMVVIVVVLALLRAKPRDGQPSHQAGAYEIGGDRIIGQHDPPEIARRAMHWPVALHANDPVGNDEARRNGGVDIEDASINALPKEIGALRLYFRNCGQRRDELILWVFYACVLRPGELFALRWNHRDANDSDQLRIDEAFGKSGLDDPKTPRSDSYVHLPPGVQALLREWKAWCGDSRPEAFMFPSKRDTAMR